MNKNEIKYREKNINEEIEMVLNEGRKKLSLFKNIVLGGRTELEGDFDDFECDFLYNAEKQTDIKKKLFYGKLFLSKLESYFQKKNFPKEKSSMQDYNIGQHIVLPKDLCDSFNFLNNTMVKFFTKFSDVEEAENRESIKVRFTYGSSDEDKKEGFFMLHLPKNSSYGPKTLNILGTGDNVNRYKDIYECIIPSFHAATQEEMDASIVALAQFINENSFLFNGKFKGFSMGALFLNHLATKINWSLFKKPSLTIKGIQNNQTEPEINTSSFVGFLFSIANKFSNKIDDTIWQKRKILDNLIDLKKNNKNLDVVYHVAKNDDISGKAFTEQDYQNYFSNNLIQLLEGCDDLSYQNVEGVKVLIENCNHIDLANSVTQHKINLVGSILKNKEEDEKDFSSECIFKNSKENKNAPIALKTKQDRFVQKPILVEEIKLNDPSISKYGNVNQNAIENNPQVSSSVLKRKRKRIFEKNAMLEKTGERRDLNENQKSMYDNILQNEIENEKKISNSIPKIEQKSVF